MHRPRLAVNLWSAPLVGAPRRREAARLDARSGPPRGRHRPARRSDGALPQAFIARRAPAALGAIGQPHGSTEGADRERQHGLAAGRRERGEDPTTRPPHRGRPPAARPTPRVARCLPPRDPGVAPAPACWLSRAAAVEVAAGPARAGPRPRLPGARATTSPGEQLEMKPSIRAASAARAPALLRRPSSRSPRPADAPRRPGRYRARTHRYSAPRSAAGRGRSSGSSPRARPRFASHRGPTRTTGR